MYADYDYLERYAQNKDQRDPLSYVNMLMLWEIA